MIKTALLLLALSSTATQAAEQSCESYLTAANNALTVTNATHRLTVHFLSDNVAHFDLVPKTDPHRPGIYVTPYVDLKTGFKGPQSLHLSEASAESQDLKIDVDPETLCVTMTDKVRDRQLTRICPRNLEQDWKRLEIFKGEITDIYGLGQHFLNNKTANANGNWMGEVRAPGGDAGNAMTPFHGGLTGNTQFPVMYALGPDHLNYAVFLDQVYRQSWDFTADPFKAEMWGDQLRWFFIAGQSLPELRTSYMNLVGRPLVPPKKAFGLWVSEYGYTSWNEVKEKLGTLRANHFPIDGFVLDLQWFGGVEPGSEKTRMGSLTFDETAFPDPAKTIKELREQEGIGLVLIEESYIGKALPEHEDLERRGFLAKENGTSTKAMYISENPWWGLGGMLDWTQPQAGAYWHDLKRQPLIEMGTTGHWTDLGEPEMYRGADGTTPWYFGFPEWNKHEQADVNNVYSLKWAESIYQGYERHKVSIRPWILSRSGGPGMQRYGATMWSADIGSNFGSLNAHLNAQMHMSMSGMDYFGADIGGFHRSGLELEPGADLDNLYTQWFANGAALDVPIRPHTENLQKSKQTAPDRIGDLASNLANLRLRYELSPYYYSLAHRAYLNGEPLMPPLVYYYQDSDTRTIADQKMIGRDLMVATVAAAGATQRDIYLPPGEWFDFHSLKYHQSNGRVLADFPLYVDGLFRLPLFARAGAILPEMHVDDKTMNILGRRMDGSRRNELIARVFPGNEGQDYRFTVFEDDGETQSYTRGEVEQTTIRQRWSGREWQVEFGATQGHYQSSPHQRQYVVKLTATPKDLEVRFNGERLTEYTDNVEFELAESGYFVSTSGRTVWAKSPHIDRVKRKLFEFRNSVSF